MLAFRCIRLKRIHIWEWFPDPIFELGCLNCNQACDIPPTRSPSLFLTNSGLESTSRSQKISNYTIHWYQALCYFPTLSLLLLRFWTLQWVRIKRRTLVLRATQKRFASNVSTIVEVYVQSWYFTEGPDYVPTYGPDGLPTGCRAPPKPLCFFGSYTVSLGSTTRYKFGCLYMTGSKNRRGRMLW